MTHNKSKMAAQLGTNIQLVSITKSAMGLFTFLTVYCFRIDSRSIRLLLERTIYCKINKSWCINTKISTTDRCMKLHLVSS